VAFADVAIVSVLEVWSHRATLLSSLTQDEREVFDRLSVDKRRKDWLAGRVAAKRAVQRKTGLPFDRIEIRVAEGGRPLVYLDGESSPWHVSITHSGDLAAAVADEAPLGLDVESIEPREAGFETLVLTPEDRARLNGDGDRDARLTLIWCEKEAYAKLVGEGLRIPFSKLSVPEEVWIESGRFEHAAVDFAWAVARRA
jgi:phosphopantetheinyl transferase